MALEKPEFMQTAEFASKDPEPKKPFTDGSTNTEKQEKNRNSNSDEGNGVKSGFRKSKPFQPIILTIAFAMLLFTPGLFGQFYGNVDMGMTYTDNAFQLSDYDLQRNEEGHPDLDFVDSADDVTVRMRFNGAYDARWRWWLIQPQVQVSGARNAINSEKQRLDLTAGVKLNRRIGSLGLYYGYTPNVYVRNYKDSDGTGESEQFTYARNQYRADLRLKPFKPSTLQLEYRLEEYFYNKYFTEFDGDITTWTLGWRQSLPTFYVEGSYGYKVYDTDRVDIDNPEDASYESNIYSAGILIKKMPLDSKYPHVMWRPELTLRFEERFFQGGDSWHRNRTDKINTTSAYLRFYLGETWNINLDYSHIFRNVDAPNSSLIRYKEYSENRFGVNVRYYF